MARHKRKTAWYMMAFVSAIVVSISLFLPLNPRHSQNGSLFTQFMTLLGKGGEGVSEKVKTSRIIIGGDVMLGRSVMAVSLDRENPEHPFLKIADFLSSADITFVNLENAIIENCPKVYRDTLKFCGVPEMIEGLKSAGVDIVTLANNHSKNYGIRGYQETIDHLKSAEIAYTDNNLQVIEKNGVKFGFVGFDFTVKEPEEKDYSLVQQADEQTDVLVLGIQWGVEYTPDPREIQRDWAKKFVEAGADVIAGHHPHWVQSHEYIDGTPVYYSLGNLIFDQMESEETRTGLLIEIVFDGKNIKSINEFETYMKDWAQPVIVDNLY